MIKKPEFDRIFKENYPRLCTFALAYTDDPDTAEEIVQQVFVNFWMRRNKLKITEALTGYLFTMVKNESLNFIRKKKTELKYRAENEYMRNTDNFDSESEDYRDEMSMRLKEAVNRLPDGRRKVFILSRYHGLKYKEIAEDLGISVKTVENQMSSAMQFIRNELKDILVSTIFIASTFFSNLF